FVATPPRLQARLEAELLALERRRVPLPDIGRARESAAAVAALPAPVETPMLALPVPVREEAPVLLPLTPPSRVTAPPPPMTGEELLPVTVRRHESLQVRLHDQVYESDAVDTPGARLPASRA